MQVKNRCKEFDYGLVAHDSQTAVLIETLVAIADVRWVSCNIFSWDHAAFAESGIPVFMEGRNS